MKHRKALLIIAIIILFFYIVDNSDSITNNEIKSESQNVEQSQTVTQKEEIDFVKKGKEQIALFNSVCDNITIDKSMVVQTTDIYTEIQLPSIKWIISELDGNPSYRFIYSCDEDIEDVSEEMAYAFYASLYPKETLRYWRDTGVAARINREAGRYDYGEWILEIEDTGTERIIEYFMKPC